MHRNSRASINLIFVSAHIITCATVSAAIILENSIPVAGVTGSADADGAMEIYTLDSGAKIRWMVRFYLFLRSSLFDFFY